MSIVWKNDECICTCHYIIAFVRYCILVAVSTSMFSNNVLISLV